MEKHEISDTIYTIPTQTQAAVRGPPPPGKLLMPDQDKHICPRLAAARCVPRLFGVFDGAFHLEWTESSFLKPSRPDDRRNDHQKSANHMGVAFGEKMSFFHNWCLAWDTIGGWRQYRALYGKNIRIATGNCKPDESCLRVVPNSGNYLYLSNHPTYHKKP